MKVIEVAEVVLYTEGNTQSNMAQACSSWLRAVVWALPGSESTACFEDSSVNVGYPVSPATKAVCANKPIKRGRANRIREVGRP
jgi:hypothetical protein